MAKPLPDSDVSVMFNLSGLLDALDETYACLSRSMDAIEEAKQAISKMHAKPLAGRITFDFEKKGQA